MELQQETNRKHYESPALVELDLAAATQGNGGAGFDFASEVSS